MLINNDIINNTIINGQSDSTIVAIVSESISINEVVPTYTSYLLSSDSLIFSGSLLFKEITSIYESIILQVTQNNNRIDKNIILDYFSILDNILILYKISISESVINVDTISGIINQIENIINNIIINDLVDNYEIIYNTVLNLISIIDINLYGYLFTISESIILNDSLNILSKVINNILENLIISLDITDKYIHIIGLLDAINLLESSNSKSIFKNILSESFIISIPSVQGQETYLAYLLSPETNSVTNYNNYNFKGCTKFNNKYLFYNETGLYEYSGSTDNGSLIESIIITAAYDFGSTNLKQVPSIYLGVSNSDKIYLKVNVDGKVNTIYTLNKKTDNLQTQKIDIGKGMIGRYFQFELITKANTFDLESIDFYPIELRRKI